MTIIASETTGLSYHKGDREVEPDHDEWVYLLEYASQLLGRSRDRFIETGEVPGSLMMGSGTGGLGPASHHAFDRRVVAVYRPCQREVDTHVAYHGYCAEHGYPGAGGRGYPEPPVHGGGAWATATWAKIRRALRESGVQEELF